MKVFHILLALVLLLPMVVSSTDTVVDVNAAKEIASVAKQEQPQKTLGEMVFVGSIKSDKYHYPSCAAAKRIKPSNEIWFSSSQDARSHGYVPCGLCNPP